MRGIMIACLLVLAGVFSVMADGYPWWLIHPVTPVAPTAPSTGIWELDADNLDVYPAPFYLTPTAGVWRLNAQAEIAPGNTAIYDAIWTTNTSGHIIMRTIP